MFPSGRDFEYDGLLSREHGSTVEKGSHFILLPTMGSFEANR
jgi:hypothetical protein